MAKYPVAMQQSDRHGRPLLKNVGSAEGNIIATIIASHISKKLRAEADQVWPRIRIHIIDMFQPPGISLSQHIERQKYTVATTPATNARTQTAMNRADAMASLRPSKFMRCGCAVITIGKSSQSCG
jgi:hypothetical protein